MNNTSNKISYISLTSQWADEKDDLLPIIERILSSGQYVGGDEITKFEKGSVWKAE